MWNFNEKGFTSVVEYYPPKTSWNKELKKSVPFDDGIFDKLPADYTPGNAEDLSSHLLVRARIKEDLAWLKDYDLDAIEAEDLGADYQYRLVMRRQAYAQAMYDLVMVVDYSSHVKETIDKRAPKVQGGRYQALMQIWGACAKWQPNNPWGNSVSFGGYGGTGYSGTAGYSSYDSKTGVTTYHGKATPAYDSKAASTVPTGHVVPKAGNYQAVGANPKALTAGVNASGAKSGFEKEDAGDRDALDRAFAVLDAKRHLDEDMALLDRDNPWKDEPNPHLYAGESEEGLDIVVLATRSSMITQLKDYVQDNGIECAEIEAAVDALQETVGTVDIFTVDDEILREACEEFKSISAILQQMDFEEKERIS